MIRNKPTFPFETIGVAVAFSPRLEAILYEVKNLANLFESRVVFIHAGKQTDEKTEYLDDLTRKLEFNKDRCTFVFRDGDAAEVILEESKEHIVDLLIAGALEKESLLRYYIGSVSREICRKAKCSVLMLTEPSTNSTRFEKIVVGGIDHPKTANTIRTAIYFANHTGAKKIDIVKELDLPSLSMSVSDQPTKESSQNIKDKFFEEEKQKLDEMISGIDPCGINLEVHHEWGKSGFVISEFARKIEADLVVINSADTAPTLLDRIFTHDMEFILANIPCNLLIVHTRE